jgi:phosphohistidine phosphatase SixA
MIPAILCNDKVFTGIHHGDAFSKLTDEEKDSCILSGFIDDLKFICNDKIIYLKEIILIRHAESTCQENEPITENGKTQALNIANFLNTINLKDFIGLTSPYIRCQDTSGILEKICKVKFKTNPNLSKKNPEENEKDFQKRINDLLEFLPEKSIIITHTDLIQNVLLATCCKQLNCIKNCSITYICKNRLIWLAKTIG